MTSIKSIAPKKTESVTVEILPADVVNLSALLNEIKYFNQALPETVMWWATKNGKKLQAAYKKAFEIDIAIEEKYVSKDDKGRSCLWDGKEDGIKAYLQVDDTTGQRTVVNEAGEPEKTRGQYFPYVKDEEQRKLYDAEKKAFNETKVELHLVRIFRPLLEKLDIPARSRSGQPLDMEMFYETLVIDPDDE